MLFIAPHILSDLQYTKCLKLILPCLILCVLSYLFLSSFSFVYLWYFVQYYHFIYIHILSPLSAFCFQVFFIPIICLLYHVLLLDINCAYQLFLFVCFHFLYVNLFLEGYYYLSWFFFFFFSFCVYEKQEINVINLVFILFYNKGSLVF